MHACIVCLLSFRISPPPSYSESSYSDTPYVASVYVPPSCPAYPSSTPALPSASATYHSLSNSNPAPSAPSASAPIAQPIKQESYRQFATESKEPFKNNDVGPEPADTHSLPMVVALYDHEVMWCDVMWLLIFLFSIFSSTCYSILCYSILVPMPC